MRSRLPVTSLRQRLAVPFDFPVHFTRHVFGPSHPLLAGAIDRLHEKRRHRVFICLDRGVSESWRGAERTIQRYVHAHRKTLELAGQIALVDGGEQAKTSLVTVRRLIRQMAEQKLDRQSVVLIIGGGAVLDVAGLAASLVHRGLRVVRMPTTVAAQNDVGVGVKTGIDLYGNKNYLGTFAPPFAVINDFDFLDRLPTRDWVAGISEAFKVAMIKNRRFFKWLCAHAAALRRRDPGAMEHLVRECARLHLDHIRSGGDPFETGNARPLDFGHWSAHQLEVMSRFHLRHGEAVAIGIALDAYIAMRKGFIDEPSLQALVAGLRSAGLPLWHPLLARKDRTGKLRILQGLERFQEHLGGPLTLTLPAPLGHRKEVHVVNPRHIDEGVDYLSNFANGVPATPGRENHGRPS